MLLCTHKAVILLQTIASQSAARLPEVRAIFTFHMKKLEYLENVQRIFWKTEKIFHERYSKVKMIITRKIVRKLTRTSKEKSRLLWHFILFRTFPKVEKLWTDIFSKYVTFRWLQNVDGRVFPHFVILFLLLFCFGIWKILCATPNENR